MAQRIALHYIPGRSALHRWDARCKILGLLMITATLLRTNMSWLVYNSVLLIGLVALSALPLRQLLRDFRTWILFLLVLFLFQAFFSPGSPLPAFPWIPVTREGLLLGGLSTWRLGLVLGYAALFTAVTRPRELQNAIIWFLRPIPFLPARRVALMVSLTLRFFSIILHQAEDVRLAHKARLGERRRNPVRKAKFLALPILRRSLLRAEDVTLALAARRYRDDAPLTIPRLPVSHLIPVVVFLGILMIL